MMKMDSLFLRDSLVSVSPHVMQQNLRYFLDQFPIPCLPWRQWQELVYRWTLENKQTPMLEVQNTYGIYEFPTIESTNFLANFIDHLERKSLPCKKQFKVHSAGCGRALYENHINQALAQHPNSFSVECSDIHASWFKEHRQYQPFVVDIKRYCYSQAIATSPDILLLFWVPPWKGSLQPETGQPEILESLAKNRIPRIMIVGEKIDHTSICQHFHDEMTKLGYQAKVFFPKFMSTIDFKPLPKGLLLSEEFISKKLSGFPIDRNVVKVLLEENWDRIPDYANSSKIILYFYFLEEAKLEDFRCSPEWMFQNKVMDVEPADKGLMELCGLFEMLHVNK